MCVCARVNHTGFGIAADPSTHERDVVFKDTSEGGSETFRKAKHWKTPRIAATNVAFSTD
jgi:hypothetical protein